jgi:hypothetical protein
MQTSEAELLPYTVQKNLLKIDHDINIKARNYKIGRRKQRKGLVTSDLPRFLGYDNKIKDNKSKICKLSLHQN